MARLAAKDLRKNEETLGHERTAREKNGVS
jgi:hypothetical protein